MRTLITGAGGFAGQHLVRDLLDAGSEVFGGTLDGRAPERRILSAEEASGVHWLPLDVTSPESVSVALQTARPERVYHLAAQSSVGGSFADPLATWSANATGTANLLYAVAEASEPGLRILIVSSGEVYGVVPEAEQPIPEGKPLQPINPYAASKAAAEMAALQVAAIGTVDVVVARSFTQTGPGQDSRFALAAFADQLRKIRDSGLQAVLRVGNLSVRRDYLDVRDAVRAYQRLVETGESGTVYNVCSGTDHELSLLVEMLVELSGTGARIEVDQARFRPADIPLLCGDPRRIQALGWNPKIPLERTLSDLLSCREPAWVPST